MDHDTKLDILERLTRDRSTVSRLVDLYTREELQAICADGLISIDRPYHPITGREYGRSEWVVRITNAGREFLKSAYANDGE